MIVLNCTIPTLLLLEVLSDNFRLINDQWPSICNLKNNTIRYYRCDILLYSQLEWKFNYTLIAYLQTIETKQKMRKYLNRIIFESRLNLKYILLRLNYLLQPMNRKMIRMKKIRNFPYIINSLLFFLTPNLQLFF